MTNNEIWQIALRQSAVDVGCQPGDFLRPDNVVVHSRTSAAARRYLELPFDCHLVSYGANIVAAVRPGLDAVVRQYIDHYPTEHCFETPNLHVLNDALQAFGLRVCYMAEYFLPDCGLVRPLPCDFALRLLTQADFGGLYLPQWSNALCEKRRALDVLGLGVYDGDTLVGLAGCSADCDEMWQIGIDVLPAYRRRGIASALISGLAVEIFKRGKVPFYCAAWSNLGSVRSAIKSGFRPAWVELTARSADFVAQQNQ